MLGNGLTDVFGGLLEGSSGVPGTPYCRDLRRRQRLIYADAQGNVVTLKLRRGGIMTLFQSPSGAVEQLELIGAVPNRSALTGSVKPGPGGTGRTTLPPITGAERRAHQVQGPSVRRGPVAARPGRGTKPF